MKNKKKTQPPAPAPRASQEITNEYTTLCVQLGNALLQWEAQKSQAINMFQKLNQEMLLATEVEKAKAEQLKATLDAKADQLVNLVADKVSNEAVGS